MDGNEIPQVDPNPESFKADKVNYREFRDAFDKWQKKRGYVSRTWYNRHLASGTTPPKTH